MLNPLKMSVAACAATMAFGFASSAIAGETVLTISGLDTPATYDIADLQELGTVTFTTSTIWTEGEQTFSGVSLHALLKSLDVESGSLQLSAINDYSVDIPVSDAVEGGPIIAYLRNNEEMSVRDKGPLWIVYPYDAVAEYQSEIIYSRSIWQLDRIHVNE